MEDQISKVATGDKMKSPKDTMYSKIRFLEISLILLIFAYFQ